MEKNTASNINKLGAFCGKRDIPSLTAEALIRTYGIPQADVMVLFGGSILYGGDVLAEAMKHQIARTYVIVGGEGHTTETLRQLVHQKYVQIETAGLSEAEVFAVYLKCEHGLEPDLLECRSTNCGNNITYLLDLLKEHSISFQSIILCQDATMQHRMEAGLRKYVSDDITIINYAVYQAEVVEHNSRLIYREDILGMWDVERYLTLLMGEIPRLSDDVDGYGPNGKNYIAHVDIPDDVMNAFTSLKQTYADKVRDANPLYASKE